VKLIHFIQILIGKYHREVLPCHQRTHVRAVDRKSSQGSDGVGDGGRQGLCISRCHILAGQAGQQGTVSIRLDQGILHRGFGMTKMLKERYDANISTMETASASLSIRLNQGILHRRGGQEVI
jgi:hypothetical protein